jgi:hypothetical protein
MDQYTVDDTMALSLNDRLEDSHTSPTQHNRIESNLIDIRLVIRLIEMEINASLL